MALSEYMPYGAPELLEGARQRMASSTAIATLTVAMIVCGLGSLLAHSTRTLAPEFPPLRTFVLLPPMLNPPVDAPRTILVAPAPASTHPQGLPVPVPDLVAPVLPADPANPGETIVQSVIPGPGGTTDLIGRVAPDGDFPGIHDYVYVDSVPNLVKGVEPVYPDIAREAGVEGVVRVLMLVGLDGRVMKAQVAPGGSVPMLDEAALVAARACVFTPALTNQHPVKVWVSRSYRFSLH